MTAFFKAFSLLNSQERREFFWLLPALVVRALLEVAAIGFLSPFLGLVLNPNSLNESGFLAGLYGFLGFAEPRTFFILVGVIALSLILASNLFSMFVLWFLLRFSWMRDYSLSHRLLAGYLHRPYLFFLNRNSADLGKNMLLEVQQGIRGVLIPGMQILANGSVAIAILLLLVIMNPVLALVVGLGLTASYAIIFLGLRRYLERIGKARVSENKVRFQTVNEAIGGVKELKLLARESHFLERYASSAKRYAHYMARSETISQLPRYFLDALIFGSLVSVLLFFLISGRSFEAAIPTLALFSFAGYRLVPALQQIYRAVSSMKFNAAAIDAIAADLEQPQVVPETADVELEFDQAFSFEDLSFRYPDMPLDALEAINLSIKKNSSVAFVGSTGSGKSTLIDLMLGLLEPSSGSLKVDGQILADASLPAWQKKLGYVPQSIYLTDSSIAENIAFGIAKANIDLEAVKKAAKIAKLDGFVESLEASYNTIVGERGVRLSGGQRQRIGIARALYHDPDVLLLDEATSALDTITEEAVFDAISELMGKKTIIMIAHRISTVKNCDTIFILDAGKIIATGNYEELISSSSRFRDLAQVS